MGNQQKGSDVVGESSAIEGITLTKAKPMLFTPPETDKTVAQPKVQKKASSKTKKQEISSDKKEDIFAEAKHQIEKVVEESKKSAAVKEKNEEQETAKEPEGALSSVGSIFTLLEDSLGKSWSLCNANVDSIQDVMEESASNLESCFESYMETVESIIDTDSVEEAFEIQEKFIKEQTRQSLNCATDVLDKVDKCYENIDSYNSDVTKAVKKLFSYF